MDAQQTLTRKEFYSLAQECRDYAMRLANFDQDSVQRGAVPGVQPLPGPDAQLR
ncbi:MAG: hypothetical protein V9H69_12300 [Anaerolineae bacterium]